MKNPPLIFIFFCYKIKSSKASYPLLKVREKANNKDKKMIIDKTGSDYWHEVELSKENDWLHKDKRNNKSWTGR
jgi:hypothetical protein